MRRTTIRNLVIITAIITILYTVFSNVLFAIRNGISYHPFFPTQRFVILILLLSIIISLCVFYMRERKKEQTVKRQVTKMHTQPYNTISE